MSDVIYIILCVLIVAAWAYEHRANRKRRELIDRLDEQLETLDRYRKEIMTTARHIVDAANRLDPPGMTIRVDGSVSKVLKAIRSQPVSLL